MHLTPVTLDRAIAADWFERFEGAGLDGVIAKEAAATYEPGKRRIHLAALGEEGFRELARQCVTKSHTLYRMLKDTKALIDSL